MGLHKSIAFDDIHVAHSLEFANAATRGAYQGASLDIGRIARQLDDGTYYILQSAPNTWLSLGSGGGGGGDITNANNVGGAAGVFRDKTTTVLNFRSLVAAATSIVVTQNADTVSIAFGHILNQTLNANNNDIQAIKVASFNAEHDNGNSGATPTVNWNNGQKQRITMTASATMAFVAPPGPCNVLIKIIQDGTGGRTITWPGTVRWPSAVSPPIQSGGANAIHIVAFYFDGTNYYGQSPGNAFS